MALERSGDGYIACKNNNGDGINNSFRLSRDKENLYTLRSSSPPPARSTKPRSLDTNGASLALNGGRGSPIFGDEYDLFRSRSTSRSSSGSVKSTGTVCESDISCMGRDDRSLRSTEPPSRILSPLDNSRDALF